MTPEEKFIFDLDGYIVIKNDADFTPVQGNPIKVVNDLALTCFLRFPRHQFHTPDRPTVGYPA